MGSGKRALLYLIRKKGRSFLLFTIILFLSCFILVGKALSQSAQNEIDNLTRNLGSSFVLKINDNNPAYREERVAEGYSYTAYVGPKITDEMLSEILEIDGVSDYLTSLHVLAWADLKLRPGLYADLTEDEYFAQEEDEVFRQTIRVYICSNGELSRNFRIGAFSIISGRNIQKEDHSVALISEYVAAENHLAIGDFLTLETKRGIYVPSKEPFERLGEPMEVEIVGIFSTNFKQEESIYTAEADYADHFIYVDYDTGKQLNNNIGMNTIDDSYNEVTFFAEAPEYVPEIMQQIKERIDVTDLLLYQDDTAYQASAKPLKQIRTISLLLSGVGILGCVLILYLVFVMWIKGRRQEIGILLSIGVNKRKILMQMLLECFMITTLALGIAIGLSKPLVDGCSHIVEQKMAPDSETETYIVEGMTTTNPEPVIQKVSSDLIQLDSYISMRDMIFLVIATYCISCGSVFAVSIRITRFNPKMLLQSM